MANFLCKSEVLYNKLNFSGLSLVYPASANSFFATSLRFSCVQLNHSGGVSSAPLV